LITLVTPQKTVGSVLELPHTHDAHCIATRGVSGKMEEEWGHAPQAPETDARLIFKTTLSPCTVTLPNLKAENIRFKNKYLYEIKIY